MDKQYSLQPRRRIQGRALLPVVTLLAGLGGTLLLCGAAAIPLQPEPLGARRQGTIVYINSELDTASPINSKSQLAQQATAPEDTPPVPAISDTKTELPWNMILVNRDHPIPAGYSITLVEVEKGYYFDERGAEQLKAMLSAARAEGLSPTVCSAYRSVEKQRELYISQIVRQLSYGYPRHVAEERAGAVVAYPGASEHHLGLAVDIVSEHNQALDETQEKTPEAKWLAAHCSEYGFILRYQSDKTEITGIIYEPWHFRYVGVEAAKQIMEQGVCLEEYLGMA